MQPMGKGWTLDHDTPAGRLYTVFSAPAYPCFGCPQVRRAGRAAAGGACACVAGAQLLSCLGLLLDIP